MIFNEPMSGHTSIKAGGCAAAMFYPENPDEMIAAARICRENDFPFFVVGNGTNLIVRDEGYGGLIIKTSVMDKIILEDDCAVYAEAGASLSDLCLFAAENGLSGLEFASGIPGTVGGAVFMNAGAYDGEIKDAVFSVSVIRTDLKADILDKGDCSFGYRESVFKKNGFMITSASFKLIKGDRAQIIETMAVLNEKRKKSQPLEMPSAGSVFKRPLGHFAGKLIAEAGLSGFKIGGAQVSLKHAGFIVNAGNASAKDILDLITHIQNEVRSRHGVELVPEPVIL